MKIHLSVFELLLAYNHTDSHA